MVFDFLIFQTMKGVLVRRVEPTAPANNVLKEVSCMLMNTSGSLISFILIQFLIILACQNELLHFSEQTELDTAFHIILFVTNPSIRCMLPLISCIKC